MREQNGGDFPLAKLDSEIKSRFLLNKHGDPHFLKQKIKFHKVVFNIYLDLKKIVRFYCCKEHVFR